MNAKHLMLGALVLAVPAFAQQPTQQPSQPMEQPAQQQPMQPEKGIGGSEPGQAMTELSRRDRDVVEKIHYSNQEEIQLGQVAQERATRDDVKQFAQTLVNDHRDADAKITQLADQHRLTLKDSPDVTKMVNKFRTLKEANFDRDFLTQIEKDHDKAIKLITRKDEKLSPEVQTLADSLLPTLEKHRAEARRLLSEVKGKASARTPATERPTQKR